jgi:hypothetical protein
MHGTAGQLKRAVMPDDVALHLGPGLVCKYNMQRQGERYGPTDPYRLSPPTHNLRRGLWAQDAGATNR